MDAHVHRWVTVTSRHRLDSQYVRDQLALRTVHANEVRLQPEGDYILYWMQSTHRLEENWALRLATLEADRLNKPLLVHQGLDPTYEHASDRIHDFILRNACELARRADAMGVAYQFVLRRRRDDDRRTVDRLAARAALVVTDHYPTAGVAERTARFAARARCRVVAVESHGAIPSGAFTREEWAARTIRPKIAKLRDHALEPVDDRPPRRALPPSIRDSLDVEPLDLPRLDVAAEVARCEIDHAVGVVPLASGLEAARARLAHFCAHTLRDYEARRSDPSDHEGSSRLSPYLHFGQIAASEVARTVLASGAEAQAAKFLDELLTWRELSLNFCLRNPRFATLHALPEWVRENLRRHAHDPRQVTYTDTELEEARTHDALWNAAQRELLATGQMHNVMRMLWGKSAILWMRSHRRAFEALVRLNNRWALDGRDPSSYAGIHWCFGKFDRPWTRRPVLGTIRYMSIERARAKYDVSGYLARWGAAGPLP
jgi:deoxyribodipyrimidine photo-lyase